MCLCGKKKELSENPESSLLFIFLFPRKTVARFPKLSGKRNLAHGDESHYQQNKEYSDRLEIHIVRIS